jgi:hypothetical protein
MNVATDYARLELAKLHGPWWKENGLLETPHQKHLFASFIGDMTGRAAFKHGGAMEAGSKAITDFAFSARYFATKLHNFVLPLRVFSGNADVRESSIKKLVGVTALAVSTMYIAKQFGYQVQLNPYSSDFGKMKLGHTRIDLFAGNASLVRFAVQFASNRRLEDDGTYSKNNRTFLVARQFMNQESPGVGLIAEAVTQKRYGGEKIQLTWKDAGQEARDHLLYMFLNDFADILLDQKAQGDSTATALGKATAGGAASWVGVGVNTYETKPPKSSNQPIRSQRVSSERPN